MALKDGFVATCRASLATDEADLPDMSAMQTPPHPSRARSRQVARPMPEPPPVTSAKPPTPRGDVHVLLPRLVAVVDAMAVVARVLLSLRLAARDGNKDGYRVYDR